jgi:KDO2-lipid IV(A) lauroyltransferase
MKRLSDFAVYAAVRLVMAVIQIMPLAWCERFAEILAYLATDVFRFRHQLVDENLRMSLGETTANERLAITRAMWKHLALLMCEVVLERRKIHETNWRKYILKIDHGLMSRYLLDSRPAVFVSGHFGNFELGAQMLGLFGFPGYAVARDLDNPYLDRLMRSFRESKGLFVFPKDGSAARIQSVLDAGHTLMLLGDQHAGTKGVWIDFLGRPASCHKALALFTLSSGAPMLVTYCRRTSGILHFEIGVSGVADPATLSREQRDVRSLTQWYNDRLASIIRDEPSQYWWVHRRWKEKPVRGRKVNRQAA